MSKNKKYLLGIIIIAFVLRLVYVLTLEDKLYFPDSFRYYEIGVSLAEGNGYDSAFTAPLYPLFLSATYNSFLGRSYLGVRILQVFISTASIFLIYLLGKNTFSEKTGLISAGLSTVYPFFIFFTGLLLTETLFILLFLILIYFLQSSLMKKQTRYLIGTGLTSGLTILIKPGLAYFLPFTFLILLLVSPKKKRIITCGLVTIVLTLIVMSPWITRNYKRFGKFIPLTTGGGITFYESNNPQATGGPGYENIVWTEEMRQMNKMELDKYFQREAINFIKSHPRRFITLAFIKFKRFWSFVPNYKNYATPFYQTISILSYGPVILLAVWGVIISRRNWRELMILYLPIIYFTLVHLIILGSLRYRVPITPYLILFAGYGITVLLDMIKTNQR